MPLSARSGSVTQSYSLRGSRWPLRQNLTKGRIDNGWVRLSPRYRLKSWGRQKADKKNDLLPPSLKLKGNILVSSEQPRVFSLSFSLGSLRDILTLTLLKSKVSNLYIEKWTWLVTSSTWGNDVFWKRFPCR